MRDHGLDGPGAVLSHVLLVLATVVSFGAVVYGDWPVRGTGALGLLFVTLLWPVLARMLSTSGRDVRPVPAPDGTELAAPRARVWRLLAAIAVADLVGVAIVVSHLIDPSHVDGGFRGGVVTMGVCTVVGSWVLWVLWRRRRTALRLVLTPDLLAYHALFDGRAALLDWADATSVSVDPRWAPAVVVTGERGELRIPLLGIDVDPDALVGFLRDYLAHPEDRDELDDARATARWPG